MTVAFYEDEFDENELLFGLTEEDLMELEDEETEFYPDLYDQYEYLLDHAEDE